MKPFQFSAGTLPLLVSIPHAGTALTPEVKAGLSDAASGLPDTDWHLAQLYDFVQSLGASVLIGNYSRFVIDLNRPADDQPLYASATTGLFPETLFDGTPTFKSGMTPGTEQRQHYLATLWTPYHQKLQHELARLKQQYGYALLFDAHSIASVIPRLFDGRLPDLNLGTNNGLSSSPAIDAALIACCEAQTRFSWIVNGRFKGGYITRAYGKPEQQQYAVQLELAQCNYMDEQPPFGWQGARAAELQPLLQQLINTLLAQGAAAAR
ncbi:N-formylglutamate deformylase [Winslowiella iniecta]|uniref:N-formylglutamate amidohydrolase n=1 Tax=Winslowiella iniecta TaxID=1560201 RepID=A0A0L7TBT1_9GAMM|nr:N-formylglutamate deformylase [Winslowiella iniecta]KOC92834.1 N-formylglutamate amidohydrolase [Winslowiella iniecta]KOC95247.1 N-formylglutamate amidohydrolase [Winslowiella iniecta]